LPRHINSAEPAPGPAPARRIPLDHLPRLSRLVDLNLAASDLFQASRSFICRAAAEAPLPDKSRSSERAAHSASFLPSACPLLASARLLFSACRARAGVSGSRPLRGIRIRTHHFPWSPTDRLAFYCNPLPSFSLASLASVYCVAHPPALHESGSRDRGLAIASPHLQSASWASAEGRGRE